jgi:cell division septal protein FtsQ
MDLPAAMNKRAKFLLASLALFTLIVYLLAWSPYLTVKEISIVGAPKEVAASVITQQSEIAIGDKLARVDPRAIKNRLSELNWIKSAEIDRQWLNGAVTISITSRVPVGIYDGQVLDATGVLFDYPSQVPEGLPVVISSTPELGLDAISLFKKLPQQIRKNLVSISAVKESSISSTQLIRGKLVVVQWGSLTEIALKVRVYQALIALPENKILKRIDLSAPHAPIVK